jgi:catechol 2,3-dioxygenase-like lactoylglutathione lyase family enzyme
MAAIASNIGTSALPWHEIHHFALITRDLAATIRFYADVLGMHMADSAPATPIHGRTYMIEPRPNATSDLHFFEHADAQPMQLHPEM